MKKYLIASLIIIIIISCTTKNQIVENLDKNLQLEKHEITKKEIETATIIDTLFNYEIMAKIQPILDEAIEFSKAVKKSDYEDFLKMEDRLRGSNYFRDIVNDPKMQSPWLTELREITKRNNQLISNYDSAELDELMYLYGWYKKRENSFWGKNQEARKFENLINLSSEVAKAKKQIDSLELIKDNISEYQIFLVFKDGKNRTIKADKEFNII